MNKKIIITGVPMAGKSTIATIIAKKLGIAHIPLDPIITAFEEVFPKIGIGHAGGEHEKKFSLITKKIQKFLFTYIDELDTEHKHNGYIIEGFHMPLEAMIKKYKKTHTIIVIGYPKTNIQKKFDEIRKYDSNNRTNEEKDTDIKRLIGVFITKSKKLAEICKKNKILFIDTSADYKAQCAKIAKKFNK